MDERLRIPVRVRDWKESHRRNSQAVNWTTGVLELLAKLNDEEALLGGNTGTYSNGQTFTNWANSITGSDDALIQVDPIAGTITIGIDGWYSVNGYVFATGSNNSAYYGVSVFDGTNNFYVGTQQWDNNNPGMVFAGSFSLPFTAGTVLSMQAHASTGTLTSVQASFGASLEGLI